MINKKQEIILIGGGGHCCSCIDVIEATGSYNIAGIVDVKQKLGQKVLGYNIIAIDEDIARLSKQYKNFFISIGHVKTADPRKQKFEQLEKLSVNIVTIVSPLAHVSKHSEIGRGTIIMHGAVVNANVKVGLNCIINTRAIIEHDSFIGEHTHVSTGAIVNGKCVVGDGTFLGSNSVLADGITISDDVVVGAGAIVCRPLLDRGVYVGNPVRRIK